MAHASGSKAAVSGRIDNTASGLAASVTSGAGNTAADDLMTVAGGRALTSGSDSSPTLPRSPLWPSVASLVIT